MIVEQAGAFAIRRAIGVRFTTRSPEGPAVITASRMEALALGDDLAVQNGVDLWIVAGEESKRLTTHRPPQEIKG